MVEGNKQETHTSRMGQSSHKLATHGKLQLLIDKCISCQLEATQWPEVGGK